MTSTDDAADESVSPYPDDPGASPPSAPGPYPDEAPAAAPSPYPDGPDGAPAAAPSSYPDGLGEARPVAPSPYPDGPDEAPAAAPSPYPDAPGEHPPQRRSAADTAPATAPAERSGRRRPRGPSRRERRELALIEASRAEPDYEPIAPDDIPPWYEDEYYDYDDWGELPKRSSAFRRAMLFLIGFSIVALGASVVVFRWLEPKLDPSGPPGDEVVIDIPDGASTNDIARILGDEGVVPDGTVFKYYLQWKDAGGYQAGSYILRENMAVWEARDLLEEGPVPDRQLPITVPEGLRTDQMRDLLLEAVPDFDPTQLDLAIAGARRPPVLGDGITSSEGFLFPDTYSIASAAIGLEAELIDSMVGQFEVVAQEVALANAPGLVGVSPYEALIVASLIEEETSVDSERGKVARVIYNRLERGEALGIDATVIYALAQDGKIVTRLTGPDLRIDSPYNTRLRTGLPPTPISAPGRASLVAALNPEAGDWLFYARTDELGEGTHRFTETLEEHEAAVEVCREKGFCD